MINFFLALILSCAKHGTLNEITARELFTGNNCLKTLRSHMEAVECDQLRYKRLGEYDIMIRCEKADKDRGDFWDNYIFRLSSPHAVYDMKSTIMIDAHTICLDKGIRIEAYPPRAGSF